MLDLPAAYTTPLGACYHADALDMLRSKQIPDERRSARFRCVIAPSFADIFFNLAVTASGTSG